MPRVLCVVLRSHGLFSIPFFHVHWCHPCSAYVQVIMLETLHIHFSVCVHVNMCVGGLYTLLCASVWRPANDIGVLLYRSIMLFFRQGLRRSPDLTCLIRLPSQWVRDLLSPFLGSFKIAEVRLQTHSMVPSLLCESLCLPGSHIPPEIYCIFLWDPHCPCRWSLT